VSIEVQSLTKEYGLQKAIDSISFVANEGTITGLVGPNGAGKTTTMKILTCFMPQSSGTATVCGMDTSKDDMAIRKLIGYLPEHNPLYGNMYIKEYLQFIARVHRLDKVMQKVDNVIEMVGLTLERNKKVSQLSKGYKQRVGIAQAIIHDPKVLILDEPISGLDPNQLQEIRKLITGLKANKTIIFSSHILQEVESICDKVVILNRGQVVADDSLNTLNSNLQNVTEIEIEFLNSIRPELFQQLNATVEFSEVGRNKFILKVDGEQDIRSDLFDLAVAENNKLLAMSMKSKSLENVFKTVTKTEDS